MMLFRNAAETTKFGRIDGDCGVEVLCEPLPPYRGLLEIVVLNLVLCAMAEDNHSYHEVLWHRW